jgi:hypothetical protein
MDPALLIMELVLIKENMKRLEERIGKLADTLDPDAIYTGKRMEEPSKAPATQDASETSDPIEAVEPEKANLGLAISQNLDLEPRKGPKGYTYAVVAQRPNLPHTRRVICHVHARPMSLMDWRGINGEPLIRDVLKAAGIAREDLVLMQPRTINDQACWLVVALQLPLV